MKVKELIEQLSAYPADADIEIMYSAREPNCEDTYINITTKKIAVVPCVSDFETMSVSSVLLSTQDAL